VRRLRRWSWQGCDRQFGRLAKLRHRARHAKAARCGRAGVHLCAGTLIRTARARGHARAAATLWRVAAAAFVVWMVPPTVDDELVRAEVGYARAAAVLYALLRALYRA